MVWRNWVGIPTLCKKGISQDLGYHHSSVLLLSWKLELVDPKSRPDLVIHTHTHAHGNVSKELIGPNVCLIF